MLKKTGISHKTETEKLDVDKRLKESKHSVNHVANFVN